MQCDPVTTFCEGGAPSWSYFCNVPLDIIIKPIIRFSGGLGNSVTRSALIAITAALLLGGTSLASAKSRAAAGARHYGLKGDQISLHAERASDQQ
jgi:hypothetical protein